MGVEPNLQAEIGPPPQSVARFGGATNETLAALLDQSVDCIKLIGPDGLVQYMNRNGLCAMEIDDFRMVEGRPWAELWPEEARPNIIEALARAASGSAARFSAFCPTAKGNPRWWDVSVSHVADEAGASIGYLSVSRDVTDAHTAREVAEIAAAEMRHRLKNSYAMIGGLLRALARGNAAHEFFVDDVSARLAALGVAQTLFVARDHAPCDLATLLPALLQPFSNPVCPVEVGAIPVHDIDQGQADALALVIGELAVNSTKHGALTAGGSIRVEARVERDRLEIIWAERSDRPVAAHARSGGQGLRLIERILTARRGEMTVDWKADGLDATIQLQAGTVRES
ncbi:MAG: hypothetical protein JWP15_2334 [Alphaproteobacteria bacterium]|nr:hypothetical protein [Alphaproteobacteria bacterium]